MMNENLSETLYGRYISERANGRIIQNDSGFIVFRSDSADCYIIEMYVLPELRKSGKGHELLNQLHKAAEEAGCQRMVAGIYLEDKCSTPTLIAALCTGFKVISANGGIIQISKNVLKGGIDGI